MFALYVAASVLTSVLPKYITFALQGNETDINEIHGR